MIMMSLKTREFAPIAAVSLEELVPQDHFYRHLQKTLDLSFVYDLVREFYALTGRPSLDPVVFFKLQLVMFFEDIRSERLLMRQVADRLSVRWYVGYNLDEPLPDHSTLSKTRTRYGLRVFRRFFEAIVEQCQQAKLVWGKELYFDATNVEANAALDSLTPRFAVERHLEQVFTQQEEGVSAQAVEEPSCEEHVPSPLPTAVSEVEYEHLATTNAHRHDWIARRRTSES
jgi:transposase